MDANIDYRKFRIFDNDLGEYIDTSDIVMTADGELMRVVHDFIETDDDAYATSYLEKLEGNFTVELSTGCRDRQNNLIYEGDIYKDLDTLFFIKRENAYGIAPHLQPFHLDNPDIEWCYEGGMPIDTAHPDFGVDIVGNIHHVVWEKR